MGNFVPFKTGGGGYSDGDLIRGVEATLAQSQLVKAVNGDDGSVHVGSVTLGQIKSGHITSPLTVATGAPAGTYTVDLTTTSQLEVWQVGGADADKALTFSFSNVKSGDILVAQLDLTGLSASHTVTLTWAGAGLVHRFPPGDDQPLSGPSRTMWVGRASSAATTSAAAAEIWWTCTRYN